MQTYKSPPEKHYTSRQILTPLSNKLFYYFFINHKEFKIEHMSYPIYSKQTKKYFGLCYIKKVAQDTHDP